MPQEDLFQTIVERHGFSLPDGYRQMWARGFFNLDRPGVAGEFTQPGDGFLWLNDMEWLSLQKMADFRFDEQFEPHLPHLLPFALNAAGDYWCWQMDRTDAHGTRVLLCPHDYAMARVYAPDFAAALFRQILEYADLLSIAPVDFVPTWEEERAHLHRWSVDLVGILPPPWIEIVRDLSTRMPVTWLNRWKREQTAFLTAGEREAIEAEQIGYPEMDAEIRWLLERG